MNSFGERLKQWRARAGLSQAEALRRLGIRSRTVLSQVENGSRAPGERLRRALDEQEAHEHVVRNEQSQSQELRVNEPLAEFRVHERYPEDMVKLMGMISEGLEERDLINIMVTIGSSDLSQASRRAGLEALRDRLKKGEKL